MYFLNAINKIKNNEGISRTSERSILVKKDESGKLIIFNEEDNSNSLSAEQLNAKDWRIRRTGEEQLNAELSLETVRILFRLVFSEKFLPQKAIEACEKNFGYEFINEEEEPDVLTPGRILELGLINEFSDDEINNVVRACKELLKNFLELSADSIETAIENLCEIKKDNDFPF